MQHRGLSTGLTGNSSTNAAVARAARALLAAARQHAVQAAIDVADDVDGTQPSQVCAGRLLQLLPATCLCCLKLLLLVAAACCSPLLQVLRTRVLRRTVLGQATVHQVWPHQDGAQLSALLDAWQLQTSFAFAVVLHASRCAVPGCRSARLGSAGAVAPQEQRQQQAAAHAAAAAGAHGGAACYELHCPLPAALVLCWSDREAAVLHLPPAAPAVAACGKENAASAGSRVWAVIRTVFGDAARSASCCGAMAALAVLRAAGVHVALAVDDPCEAFLLWQVCGGPAVLCQACMCMGEAS